MEKTTQDKLNKIFVIFLISSLILNLVILAFRVLPQDPLFFVTSDAMEYIICGALGFAIMYWIIPMLSLPSRLLIVTCGLAILILLAYLKAYRRNVLDLSYILDQFFSFVGLTAFFFFIIYFFKNMRHFIGNTMHKTEEALKTAENQLVRQQFDPHFLYNMFNSLYSMSLQNHPQLSDTILKMSNLSRYVTDHRSNAKTPISKELKFLEEFVELQRTRFGENANISFEIYGDLEDIYIAPLLLMTPVENAFKHGFYTNNEHSFVHIKLMVDDKRMTFSCLNSVFEKQHFQMQYRKGKGLENLKRRLELSYTNHYNLEIKEEKEIYNLKLIIEHE